MQNTSQTKRVGLSFVKGITYVYSNWKYAVLSIFITAIFWVFFNILDQRIFFSPVIAFYIPSSAMAGFVLSSMIAVLLGVSASMNIYGWRSSCGILTKGSSFSLFSSSSISIFASICAACAPSIATFLTMILGGSTAIALYSFMSKYQGPMLTLSLLLLLCAIYVAGNKLSNVCHDNKS